MVASVDYVHQLQNILLEHHLQECIVADPGHAQGHAQGQDQDLEDHIHLNHHHLLFNQSGKMVNKYQHTMMDMIEECLEIQNQEGISSQE